jgi:hypothetical protein
VKGCGSKSSGADTRAGAPVLVLVAVQTVVAGLLQLQVAVLVHAREHLAHICSGAVGVHDGVLRLAAYRALLAQLRDEVVAERRGDLLDGLVHRRQLRHARLLVRHVSHWSAAQRASRGGGAL